jgi:hypothetical protein
VIYEDESVLPLPVMDCHPREKSYFGFLRVAGID